MCSEVSYHRVFTISIIRGCFCSVLQRLRGKLARRMGVCRLRAAAGWLTMGLFFPWGGRQWDCLLPRAG